MNLVSVIPQDQMLENDKLMVNLRVLIYPVPLRDIESMSGNWSRVVATSDELILSNIKECQTHRVPLFRRFLFHRLLRSLSRRTSVVFVRYRSSGDGSLACTGGSTGTWQRPDSACRVPGLRYGPSRVSIPIASWYLKHDENIYNVTIKKVEFKERGE